MWLLGFLFVYHIIRMALDLTNWFLNRWSIIVGLIVIIALSIAAWIFSPKGENQVYVF